MENRKRRGRIESLIGKIFILSLFLILLINLIVPDKEQSEQENRVLETHGEFADASVDEMEKFWDEAKSKGL